MRTKPPFDFFPLLAQHFFACAAESIRLCSKFPQTGHSMSSKSADYKPLRSKRSRQDEAEAASLEVLLVTIAGDKKGRLLPPLSFQFVVSFDP
jgi:hypothetical protein